jgi:hypothetical protein
MTITKQIPLFAAVGLVSGLVCWLGQYFLPESFFVTKVYPGVVLGVFIYIACRFIAECRSDNHIRSFAFILVASAAGWRLAVDVGYDLGGPVPFAIAGAMGAAALSLGVIMAWRVHYSKAAAFVAIVTVAGTLGGLLFNLIDRLSGMYDRDTLWVLTLFCEWQAVLLIGIALALHHNARTEKA